MGNLFITCKLDDDCKPDHNQFTTKQEELKFNPIFIESAYNKKLENTDIKNKEIFEKNKETIKKLIQLTLTLGNDDTKIKNQIKNQLNQINNPQLKSIILKEITIHI